MKELTFSVRHMIHQLDFACLAIKDTEFQGEIVLYTSEILTVGNLIVMEIVFNV